MPTIYFSDFEIDDRVQVNQSDLSSSLIGTWGTVIEVGDDFVRVENDNGRKYRYSAKEIEDGYLTVVSRNIADTPSEPSPEAQGGISDSPQPTFFDAKVFRFDDFLDDDEPSRADDVADVLSATADLLATLSNLLRR